MVGTVVGCGFPCAILIQPLLAGFGFSTAQTTINGAVNDASMVGELLQVVGDAEPFHHQLEPVGAVQQSGEEIDDAHGILLKARIALSVGAGMGALIWVNSFVDIRGLRMEGAAAG